MFYVTTSWDLPIDAIDASGAVPARVGVALVDVDLAVPARSARLAAALVPADQVFAVACKWHNHYYNFRNIAFFKQGYIFYIFF